MSLWESCKTCKDVSAFGDYLDASGYADKERIRTVYAVAMVMGSRGEREALRARLEKYGIEKDIADGRIYRGSIEKADVLRADDAGGAQENQPRDGGRAHRRKESGAGKI